MITYRARKLEEELKILKALATTCINFCAECEKMKCKSECHRCYNDLCNDVIDKVDAVLKEEIY